MNYSSRNGATLALLAVLTLTSSVLICPATVQAQEPQSKEHDMTSMKGMSEGSNELHKSMMKGMKDMQGMKMTGNVDKDFASMMIDHHRQAIAMAQVQLEHGKDAELRQQAQKIIDDSQKDIEVLQKKSKR